MAKFKNVAGITHLEFKHTVQCYCTIGKTLCTYNLFVQLNPTTYIPDYLEVQSSLDELNNGWYTLEDACAAVFSKVSEQVENEWKYLKVVVECCDARHFPATVEKEVQL